MWGDFQREGQKCPKVAEKPVYPPGPPRGRQMGQIAAKRAFKGIFKVCFAHRGGTQAFQRLLDHLSGSAGKGSGGVTMVVDPPGPLRGRQMGQLAAKKALKGILRVKIALYIQARGHTRLSHNDFFGGNFYFDPFGQVVVCHHSGLFPPLQIS